MTVIGPSAFFISYNFHQKIDNVYAEFKPTNSPLALSESCSPVNCFLAMFYPVDVCTIVKLIKDSKSTTSILNFLPTPW